MPESSAGLLWSILLLTVVGVGALLVFTVAWAYRKRIRNDETPGAFTLQDLRDMLESGSISQIEFETMRAAILEQARRTDEPPAEAAPPIDPASYKERQNDAEDDNIQP